MIRAIKGPMNKHILLFLTLFIILNHFLQIVCLKFTRLHLGIRAHFYRACLMKVATFDTFITVGTTKPLGAVTIAWSITFYIMVIFIIVALGKMVAIIKTAHLRV